MYISPKHQFHPDPPSGSKERWSRRLQYLYFLRFCVLGWLLLPLVCVLDSHTGASALTRGIMTLSTRWQAFHAMFFVVTLSTATLVCARNIVMNGNFRFASQPPVGLYRWLTACRPRTLWTVLAVAQIPSFITLWYVACITIREQVGFANSDAGTWPYAGWHWSLWGWFAAGLLAAFAFWYIVTLFYLWTHEWIPGDGPRALIFPPLWPKVENAMQGASKPRLAAWMECVLRWPLQYTHAGYAPDSGGPLWELHFLTTVSLIAFGLLYLFLYPIVAPVVTTTRPTAEVVFAAAICLFVLLGARRIGSRWEMKMEKTGAFFASLFMLGWAFFVYFLVSDERHHYVKLERSFPVLASVTVILIFVQWGINGASFFFDRYRIPVLTSVIAVIFLPKLALSYIPAVNGNSWIEWVQTYAIDWDADHYFEVRQAPPVAVLPTPTDALTTTLQRVNAADRLNSAQPPNAAQPPDNDNPPLVVVTATGGGIQAAEWTAQVMTRLEEEFRNDKQKQLNGYLLHDHLLLASGVSGGSVGLVPYLLEYTAPPGTGFPANDDLRDRLTIGPGCSSLEAVAWGLEYYDFQRLALTFRFPILQSAQDAPTDAATTVEPDRTWALSRALNRNLSDPQCGVSPNTPKVPDAETITLAKTAQSLANGTMPAFTLNTTVAESGGRFLLSNYMVPPAVATPSAPANTEFLPAESFLQAYAYEPCCANGPHGEKLYADLPLSTAARLSATFPVVSSATRVPRPYAKVASHFLDGGYFDNDGTGSAIEFLYSVMDQRTASQSPPPANPPATRPPAAKPLSAKPVAAQPPSAKPSAAKPLKVLLVEIRDGQDLNPHVDPDDLQHQTAGEDPGVDPPPDAWWTLDQLLGPLEGLWNAGHVSVTRRNRRELCVLETAYKDQLIIHHVVFAIPPERDKKDKPKPAPLSWKLTASQLAYISSVAHGGDLSPTGKAVNDALKWIAAAEKSTPSSEVCTVSNAPTK